MDWFKTTWVVGTVFLIAFISYSSQIFIIWPWYGRELSVDLLKLLIPFNLLVAMVFWNYYLCVATPPGSVPLGYRPNMQGSEYIEVKRGNSAPRFCKMCGHYKPPRAHHCRQCKTCVLKLDHHCPWIANCVGYHNHGHFIRFLWWVDFATTYHLVMMCAKVKAIIDNVSNEPTASDIIFLVFNFTACVPVWMCVGLFSWYHLYLISSNTTTVERWEKDKVATLVRRGKIEEITYPYNLGRIANIKTVLGSNPLLWLWPQEMEGDGLSYAVNPEAGEPSAQYSWPPRDPQYYQQPAPMPAQPFVYGDGLNPALKPSSMAKRARDSCYVPAWDTRLDENGFAVDDEDTSSSSSPEPYHSDWDEEDDRPLAYASSMRVRRGSEGWEVRPGQQGWSTEVPVWERPAWEQPGRYRTYVPEADYGEA